MPVTLARENLSKYGAGTLRNLKAGIVAVRVSTEGGVKK
jgi:hypothetical protein